MRATHLAMALLLLGLPGAALCADAAPAIKLPAGVPEGYVVTPFGYFHQSCVRHLAKGERLMPGGHAIRRVDGSLESVPDCAYPHYTAKGEVVAQGFTSTASAGGLRPAAAGEQPTGIVHAWIEDAYTSATSYGELTASWVVPPSPTSQDGQTVYFFPGFEGSGGPLTILQPVLGWNADFQNTWSIASWNCCPSSTAVESTAEHASPGDAIMGVVQSTCPGSSYCPDWKIMTTDLTTGQSANLYNTPAEGNTFNWACAALEVYSVSQCSDYPPNGSLTFNSLALYDANYGQIAAPSWSHWSVTYTPQCNYGVQAGGTTATLDYAGFTLASSPGSLALIAGGASQCVTVTVADVTGFSGSVTLFISGLPSGVTANFGTNPASASSLLTLSASSGASLGSCSVTITASSGSLTALSSLALSVAPPPTPTETVTPTPSSTPTASRTATPSATPSITPTFSASPTASPSPVFRQVSGKRLLLAPVPAYGGEALLLFCPSQPVSSIWSIYDIAGRLVGRQASGSAMPSYSTAHLASGVYLVRVEVVLSDGSRQSVLQKVAVLR